MPDWTYTPLSPVAERVLGEARARRWALRSLSGLAGLPGGSALIRAFLHDPPPAEVRRRVGALVPEDVHEMCSRVLPLLGAGVVVTASQVQDADLVLDDPDPEVAAQALERSHGRVLASAELLIRAGPGWFQRVGEASLAGLPTTEPATLRDVPLSRPRSWPA